MTRLLAGSTVLCWTLLSGCGGPKTATRQDPGAEKLPASCESTCGQQQVQCLHGHGILPGEGSGTTPPPGEVSKADWEANFKKQQARRKCEEAHQQCLENCGPSGG